MAEDDWDGWAALTEALADKVQIVGDDVFVTNQTRLERGIAAGAANSILIKLNQVGNTHRDARHDGPCWSCRIRVRRLAPLGRDRGHLHCRPGCCHEFGQLKTGAPARSDRVAKYNELLRIEEELGESAAFYGRGALRVSRGPGSER